MYIQQCQKSNGFRTHARRYSTFDNAILEQLFNAADIAVVGNFIGELKTISVAAVGANSSIIGLLLNLFIGISLGANVVIANGVGQKDHATIQKTVHTSF